ncbi:MAG: FkbM family methyltransferase [Pseudomonadales bacterium]|jgi:FkbM family methyltransferase|nr:FkbM family methyltransferase [Pseudomonadales bacterium]
MKVQKINTRYGKMNVLASDQIIAKSLIEYGEWSQSEIDLLTQVIKPGMKVLDIGANIGSHTLAFAKAVGPRGKVLAFEPQPFVHSLLAANLIENDATNVLALNAGLGRAPGWVDLPDFTYAEPNNYGALRLEPFLTKDEKAVNRIPVPIHRLDDLKVAAGAHVIKIDVEEMEAAVLEGARGLISASRPLLFVENELPGEGSEATLRLLFEMEYDAYWQVAPLFPANNFNGKQENIFGNMTCMNVFAVPKERAITVQGSRKVQSVSEHPRKRHE